MLDFHDDFLSSLNHIGTIALLEARVKLFVAYFDLLTTSKISSTSSAITS